jgi:hypothetical protein
MNSTGEMAVELFIYIFVGSAFVGVVVCTSVLLKKCYDKCVTDLPDVVEIPSYANATISIIPTVMVETTFSELTDDSADNVIAVEINV